MSDFTFVGSASLLGTSGQSSEGRNVCLWDTLLPQKSALVQGKALSQNTLYEQVKLLYYLASHASNL